jgi:hypothetical protein
VTLDSKCSSDRKRTDYNINGGTVEQTAAAARLEGKKLIFYSGGTMEQDSSSKGSKDVKSIQQWLLKGTVQRDFNSVFCHILIGLGLNMNRF